MKKLKQWLRHKWKQAKINSKAAFTASIPSSHVMAMLYVPSEDILNRKDRKYIFHCIKYAVKHQKDYVVLDTSNLHVKVSKIKEALDYLAKRGYMVIEYSPARVGACPTYLIYWGPNADKGLNRESKERLIYFARVIYSSGAVTTGIIWDIGNGSTNLNASSMAELIMEVARYFDIVEKKI
jgi:hypothetical protein